MSVSDASICAERKMPPPLPLGALLRSNVLFLTRRSHPDGRDTERDAPEEEEEEEDVVEGEEYEDDDEREGESVTLANMQLYICVLASSSSSPFREKRG